MLRTLALCLGLLVAAAAPAAAQAPPIVVDAGDGVTVRVERAPFRIAVVGADGRETVATVPGSEGAPVRPPGVDGPFPLEPAGAAGAFPALGWVVGAQAGVTYPLPFFTGNRLFGAEAGGVVAVRSVTAATPVPGGVDLVLATDAGRATATLRTLPGGGVALDARAPEGLPGVVSTVTTLTTPADEGLYGLGGRKDRLDQRGLLRNVWVEQQNASDERGDAIAGETTFPNGAQAAYYVQSALHGSRGWTAWVDQTELGRLDLAASRPDALRWAVAAPRMTLNLAGGGLERSTQAYTARVGRAPAPPRYVYEPWLDVINEGEGEAAPNGAGFTGGARVRRELEEVVARAREHGVPLGVLGVEGWHTVPGGPEFFAALRRQGFRLAAYWNPFTSRTSPAFAEAERDDVLVKDPLGRPYELVNNRGGRVSVIDFSAPNAAAFWRRQLDRSKALGFEAFMHDFGEFVTEGMVFANGNPPAVEHNAYPNRMHAAARAAIDAQARETPGFEPWFYVRAGFTGTSAQTSGVFPGDETTDFSQASGLPSVPPAMLNLALGGSYTFTTDVGGYLDLTSPRTTPELFTRWSQLAALTPVSRIHNSTFGKSVYPWELGPAALDAYRRYARLKRRLIPLVDGLSRRAASDGTIGPVRPLVLDDPSPAARSIDDEWLLGRDLLVAPVLTGGARERRVYLPAGAAWERVVVGDQGELVPRGAPLPGGSTVVAPAPLADIPLFRRVAPSPAGCRSRRGFASVSARPDGDALRLSFRRRLRRAVTVDVFRQSAGRRVLGERLVARRARGFAFRPRGVADGVYLVRFRMREDTRRVVVERRGGRFRLRPGHERPGGCDRLLAAKLERPVFGGTTRRSLGIAFRVARAGRVRVEVLAAGRVVRTLTRSRRAVRTTHRLRLAAGRLPRGDVRVRFTLDGAPPVTLTARRL